MKKPIIINLYGAPGAGKSTGGAYIYSNLKMKGVHVRMLWNEEIEDKTADEEQGLGNFASQIEDDLLTIQRNYMPEVIINTMPIGQLVRNDIDLIDEYMVDITDNSHSKNYLLLRVKPYRGDGRNHTEEESDDIGRYLRKYLNKLDVKYSAVGGHKEGYDCIIEDIMDTLNDIERYEQFERCY